MFQKPTAGRRADGNGAEPATWSRASAPRLEPPMSVEALSVIILAVAAAGLAVAAVVLVRLMRLDLTPQPQNIEVSIARSEQGLRDELARGRQENAADSKLLREEV